MNSSIIFSMHMLSMINFFDFIIENWILSMFNIGPSSLPKMQVLVEELAKSRFCCFALAFDRLEKSTVCNFNAYSSSWTSGISCHCCSNLSQTCLIHEKFGPMSEYCLCSKTWCWFPLYIHLACNWLWLPIRVQFWCFSDLIFQVKWFFIFWQDVLTTSHCICELWKFYSVRSLNCNKHGLLCRCQHQSLLSVGGHYNVRLFKLSRPKRRRNFHEFSTDDSPHLSLPNSQSCFGGSKRCVRELSKAGENGQYSNAGRQLILDNTVGSWVCP